MPYVRGARQRLRRLHAMTIEAFNAVLAAAPALSRSLFHSLSQSLPLARSLLVALAFAAALRIGSNYCGKPLSYNLPD